MSRIGQKLVVALLVLLGSLDLAVLAAEPEAPLNVVARDTLVVSGIQIVFSAIPLQQIPTADTKIHAGDEFLLRFAISDVSSRQALTGAFPAAWLDKRPDGGAANTRSCVDKIRRYLGGGRFSRAERDLNIYYVLVLNEDNTISVVDPLFGFGGSRLVNLLQLPAPGHDWLLCESRQHLYVSVPQDSSVCVFSMVDWKLEQRIELPGKPGMLAIQPDEHYVWVALNGGNTDSELCAVATGSFEMPARFAVGKGSLRVICGPDNRNVYALADTSGIVAVADVASLKLRERINLGGQIVTGAWSRAAHALYLALRDRRLVSLDGTNHNLTDEILFDHDISALCFTHEGRFASVLHTRNNLLQIVDCADNRIVQHAHLESQPQAMGSSDNLLYISHAGTESVLMISLQQFGKGSDALQVVDFPGGRYPVGGMQRHCSARLMVQAPGASAMLIANSDDMALYYYMEGMAAPMGSFSNYGRRPRAVLAVDRSLRQRQPGHYETALRVDEAGHYDVAFYLDAPRVTHCFQLDVSAPREPQASDNSLSIVPLDEHREIALGESVSFRFALVRNRSGQPITDRRDVEFLAMLSPGRWHTRLRGRPEHDGSYSVQFEPPLPGLYYVHLACPGLGIDFNNPFHSAVYVHESVEASE